MDGVYRARRLKCFCHKLLEAATRKFSKKNIIGEGGFGEVYIGYINSWTMTPAKRKDGVAIAVKKLRRKGSQGQNEWENELDFLSRLNHPNVVELIGYCSEGEDRMLVYEYMTEGNLEDHLLSGKSCRPTKNFRICVHFVTIVRDKKILQDFKAKLSDFGLARFGPLGERSHISTRVLGTKGYFAPEYIATGRLTVKTDVYSFGVVLLEILLGKDAVKKYPNGLAGMWAKPYLSNKQELCRVVDERLGKNIRMEEAQEFAQIILRCLSLEPKTRPTMTQVVAYLEQLELHMGGNQDFLRLSHAKKSPLFEHFT
ncbi:hypothetical protein Pint_22689 [Pistacia integerrima]|uniref:Uncharacterized protein n=1 Tax=Pistacia integerrima TaxID=434235 RepID=A0ACC0YNT7_9ROSI|nr:hypothetical protein Pint_22689 [Pistacia integerrima]